MLSVFCGDGSDGGIELIILVAVKVKHLHFLVLFYLNYLDDTKQTG